MKEYRFSVSVNGQFLFRSDWDTDKQRAESAAYQMPNHFTVSFTTRTTTNSSEVVQNES